MAMVTLAGRDFDGVGISVTSRCDTGASRIGQLVDGRVTEALTLMKDASSAAAELDDPWVTAYNEGNAGLAALLSGSLDDARRAFLRQVDMCGRHQIRTLAARGHAAVSRRSPPMTDASSAPHGSSAPHARSGASPTRYSRRASSATSSPPRNPSSGLRCGGSPSRPARR